MPCQNLTSFFWTHKFPGTSRNDNSENRETTGDRSTDDLCTEVRYFFRHTGQINSPEAEIDPHMVTGATEEIRQYSHVTTETQEKIPYWSPSTPSRSQKKARSTSQPQFCSENTLATIEADQIFLALQQLATNNHSANFNNNISRISKWPNSLTITMPTFDGKTEKLELFEDLFQTSLKIHNQLTEEEKINYLHTLMRGDALQTFKNITTPTKRIWQRFWLCSLGNTWNLSQWLRQNKNFNDWSSIPQTRS